jgi:superfamily II DNA or RNA helicase
MTANVQGTIVVPKSHVSDKMRRKYTYIRKGFGGEPIVTYSYTEDKLYSYFSRDLKKFRRYCELPFEYNLVEGGEIEGELADGFKLYDYQEEVASKALAQLSSDINCLIHAPVRFGKTITLIHMITKLKRTTLILVDKTLLVDQFIEDTRKFSNLDIGVLDKNNETVRYDVAITTFQYLNANPELLKRIKGEFGVLAVDEMHVSAATTYANIINSFPTRYRIGVTATPTRSSDKLTGILHDMFGTDVIVGKNTNALKATIRKVTIPKQYFPSPYSPKASLSKYLLSPEVQEVVAGLLKEHTGKTIMIVSDIKKVQAYYSDYALNSDMGKKERAEVMTKINSGEIKVFSGYNVMLKGVTIPKLEVIIHMFAATTHENVNQLRGRLLTPPNEGESKEPLFIELQTKNMSWKECQRERWLQP